jgi:hypothetical protein
VVRIGRGRRVVGVARGHEGTAQGDSANEHARDSAASDLQTCLLTRHGRVARPGQRLPSHPFSGNPASNDISGEHHLHLSPGFPEPAMVLLSGTTIDNDGLGWLELPPSNRTG